MKGIVVVEDTDSIGIVVEDIATIDTAWDDTKATLIQLASVHYFSLSRYPVFSLAIAKVFCNLFHHDLLICKIYNTD